MTPRISILPKRRLLATAVALIVSGTAWQATAQTVVTTATAPAPATKSSREASEVVTCPLGSFICAPRPVSYAMCSPNAMLDFYDPTITKDTTLRATAVTDTVSNINGTEGVKVESPEPNQYHMTGGVRLQRADQVLQAEDVTYNADSTAYDATGNVRYQEAGMLLRADRMTGTTTPNQGDADHVTYQLLQSRGNGVADHAKMTDPMHGRMRLATYSTCDVGKHQWEFRAKTVDLNKDTGVGTAHYGTMRFKGVPFMYLPYFTFPLDDRRKSGFLYPTFGSSSHSGEYLSLPYYLNLAPNYDATVTPTYYASRGAMLGVEFRYLTPRSNGTFDVNYLANDKGTDTDFSTNGDRGDAKQRYLAKIVNTTNLGDGFMLMANINRASDNEYFRDFGNDLYSSSVGILSSGVYVTKGTRYWSAAIGVDAYQNVDPGLPNYVEPYKRWPRATFSAEVPLNSWLDVGVDTEAVAFRKANPAPGQIDGNRLDLAPYVAGDFGGSAWFVRPRLEYRYTGYQLQNADDKAAYPDRTPSRSLPIASLDSGLIFDRSTHMFGSDYTQTLEPRVYYLYVPYRNQKDLPNFDSNEMSFDFWQLFTTNRFAGADRQMDANNVSAALTSRLLDDNGVERVSASIGQIRYLTNQKVQFYSTQDPTNFNGSNYVAQLAVQLNDKWRVNASYQWDPNNKDRVYPNPDTGQYGLQGHESDLATVQFQRRIKGDGVFNFSYRYRRNVMEQFDTSVVYPVSERWRALARWVFARRDIVPVTTDGVTFTSFAFSHRTLEATAGVEYDSCCVAFRILGRHYVQDYTRRTNNAIMFELEFKGLGSLNPQSGEYLRRAILGYQ
ncbi:LPS assembly protein LptD [Luteibacter aegosomaticola]|uniref:LPS-assembly protein LptD n=1 Tax=Luteibacter aegosomaticola TaxID=2911538 RepID=UPI001FF8A08B|nr:LPS assembly protein LptD [Luteibacter aegosomaticola]UPG89380.1 LPS assembly protein LptD [Luteibacter aegosomaticola]